MILVEGTENFLNKMLSSLIQGLSQAFNELFVAKVTVIVDIEIFHKSLNFSDLGEETIYNSLFLKLMNWITWS